MPIELSSTVLEDAIRRPEVARLIGAGAVATGEYELIYNDDFVFGRNEDGEYGDLGWNLFNAEWLEPQGEANHPGIKGLTVGASATGCLAAYWRLSVGLSVEDASVAFVRGVLRSTTSVAGMGIRFGRTNDGGLAGELSQGIYFSYLESLSANWRCVTRDDAGITVTTTGVPVTLNTWYDLKTVRRADGEQLFYINGSLVATHTTNVPTGVLTYFFGVQSENTTDSKSIHVDLFQSAIRSMTRYEEA